MRLVLDSNIIVAAFSGRGLCNSLFELCQDRFHVVISEFIVGEVQRVLMTKIKMPEKNVNLIIDYLKEFCIVENCKNLVEQVCRDRDDDNIIALAKQSNSKYIITGNKDLLVLKKYGNIKIYTARDFWEEVKQSDN